MNLDNGALLDIIKDRIDSAIDIYPQAKGMLTEAYNAVIDLEGRESFQKIQSERS